MDKSTGKTVHVALLALIALMVIVFPALGLTTPPPDNVTVSTSFDVNKDGTLDNYVLTKFSIRSRDYQLLTVDSGGFHFVDPANRPHVRTYRGYLQGDKGYTCDATINPDDTLSICVYNGRESVFDAREYPCTFSGPAGTPDPGNTNTVIPLVPVRQSPSAGGGIRPRVNMREIQFLASSNAYVYYQTSGEDLELAVARQEQSVNNLNHFYARDIGVAPCISIQYIFTEDVGIPSPQWDTHPDAVEMNGYWDIKYQGGQGESGKAALPDDFFNYNGGQGFGSSAKAKSFGHEYGHSWTAQHEQGFKDIMDGSRSTISTATQNRMIDLVNIVEEDTCPSIIYGAELPPRTNDDFVGTVAGESVDLDLLRNDFDNNGDYFFLTDVTESRYGSKIEILNDRVVRYTPAPGFIGIDTFNYEVTDSEGYICRSGLVKVSVSDPSKQAVHYTYDDVDISTGGRVILDHGDFDGDGSVFDWGPVVVDGTQTFESTTGVLGNGLRRNAVNRSWGAYYSPAGFVPGNSDYTLSIWVRPDNLGTSGGAAIVKATGTSSYGSQGVIPGPIMSGLGIYFLNISTTDPILDPDGDGKAPGGFLFCGNTISYTPNLGSESAVFGIAVPVDLVVGQWYHLTMVFDRTAQELKAYVDGVEWTQSDVFGRHIVDEPIYYHLGTSQNVGNAGQAYTLDEFRSWYRTLSDTEISDLSNIATTEIPAGNPNPGNNSKGANEDQALSWDEGIPGRYTFDVYFGSDENAVATATPSDPEFKGNQTATSYTPVGMEAHNTYYWRVDSINGTTVVPGSVWSFSTDARLFTGLENPSFEDDLLNATIPTTSGTGVSGWWVWFYAFGYTHGTVQWAAEDPSEFPAAHGANWAEFHKDSGYAYQLIGDLKSNQDYEIKFLMGKRNSYSCPGIEVELWHSHLDWRLDGKDFWHTPERNGATFITSQVVNSTLTGMQTQEMTITINTGTTGLDSEPLILAFKGRNGGRTLIDNIRVTPIVDIEAPTGLVATSTTAGTVDLDWDNHGNASLDSYSVYSSQFPEGPFERIATGLTSSNYTDSTPNNGDDLYYVVTAVHTNGSESEFSLSSRILVSGSLSAPSAPTGLSAAGDIKKADLSWTTNGSASYSVYRGLIPGGAGSVRIAKGLTGGSYTDEKANYAPAYQYSPTPGYTYYYTVRAVNASGVESADSNEAPAKVVDTRVGNPITTMTATNADKHVFLDWKFRDDATSQVRQRDFKEYRIFRSETAGGPYTDIGSAYNAHYRDFTAAVGTTYYYIVKEIDFSDNEVASNEVSGTALADAAPPVPTNLSLMYAVEGEIKVEWDRYIWPVTFTDFSHFNIYRSETQGSGYQLIGTKSVSDPTRIYQGRATTLAYADTTPILFVDYYYVLTAVDTAGNESAYSNEVTAQVDQATRVILETDFDGATLTSSTGSDPLTGITWTQDADFVGIATGVTDVDSFETHLLRNDLGNSSNNVMVDWDLTDTPASERGIVMNFSIAPGGAPIPLDEVVTTTGHIKYNGSFEKFGSDLRVEILNVTENKVLSSDTLVNHGNDIRGWTTAVIEPNGVGVTLLPGNDYRVTTTRANYTSGWGCKPAWAFVQLKSAIPITPVPTGLTATDTGSGVDLAWSDESSDPVFASYNVYRSEDGGIGFALLASGVTTNSYADITAVSGNPYYYKVSTISTYGGYSDYSNIAAVNDVPPSAPTDLIALAGDMTVTLDWADNPEGDISGYTVKRSTTFGGPYNVIETGLTGSDHVDTSVTNGTIYYYIVTATDIFGNESAGSSEVPVRPSPAASPMLNTTTFDGAEPTTDGNAAGFRNQGTANFDTVNGWTWATSDDGGSHAGTLFAGIGHNIGDQEIRVGSELKSGYFSFDWGNGNNANSQTALAQAFTLSGLGDVTVTYDLSNNAGGMYLYIDDGSGSYSSQAHTMTNGTGQTYPFTPTGTSIRIAVVGNDGADSNGRLEFIEVKQVQFTGDLNGDGLVNLIDFSLFAQNWQDTACGECNGADQDGDSDVDLADLQKFAESWLGP